MGICSWFKTEVQKKAPPGILVVIIGHGTSKKGVMDKGAWGTAPISMSEFDYNNLVASDMATYAKEIGLSCVILNKKGSSSKIVGDTTNNLVAEFGGKGCAIELHFNSFNKVASGTEVLFDTREKDNAFFAGICLDQMVSLFKKPNRGIKDRTKEGRGKENLEFVKVTSCLVEPLFGDTEGDAKLLKNKRTEYARCLVDAAVEYLKGKS